MMLWQPGLELCRTDARTCVDDASCPLLPRPVHTEDAAVEAMWKLLLVLDKTSEAVMSMMKRTMRTMMTMMEEARGQQRGCRGC